jgi:hypothetical protein
VAALSARCSGASGDRLSEPARFEAPAPRQNALGDASELIGESDGQHIVVETLLRQTREALSDIDTKVNRLLASVEQGVMEPGNPALKERLAALRLQKTELGREIVRLQESLHSCEPNVTPEKLSALSVAMRKRLADGPQQLRQAYMRLILDMVMVGAHEIRLEGPPAALERLARDGASSSLPEVLSFA